MILSIIHVILLIIILLIIYVKSFIAYSLLIDWLMCLVEKELFPNEMAAFVN